METKSIKINYYNNTINKINNRPCDTLLKLVYFCKINDLEAEKEIESFVKTNSITKSNVHKLEKLKCFSQLEVVQTQNPFTVVNGFGDYCRSLVKHSDTASNISGAEVFLVANEKDIIKQAPIMGLKNPQALTRKQLTEYSLAYLTENVEEYRNNPFFGLAIYSPEQLQRRKSIASSQVLRDVASKLTSADINWVLRLGYSKQNMNCFELALLIFIRLYNDVSIPEDIRNSMRIINIDNGAHCVVTCKIDNIEYVVDIWQDYIVNPNPSNKTCIIYSKEDYQVMLGKQLKMTKLTNKNVVVQNEITNEVKHVYSFLKEFIYNENLVYANLIRNELIRVALSVDPKDSSIITVISMLKDKKFEEAINFMNGKPEFQQLRMLCADIIKH